jgi:perosamine synthetase
MIPIYKPYLAPYKHSAIQSINDEWISNHGIYVDLASTKFREMLNVKYTILMNNGTSATHCLYKALKYKYPHIDHIDIPNYVFIAPWNCGLMEYPVSAFEVMKHDPETMNIDVSEKYIATLKQNSAVMIVHNLGNIVNIPRLQRLRPDIVFIEDNCEGLFGKHEMLYSGTQSFASAVSFYGNKTITSGEGGAFFTNDIDVYKYIKTYYSHGMSDQRYIHSMVGTNYRMTNVQAAFLYDQMNDINTILDRKKCVFDYYKDKLSEFYPNIYFLKSEPNTQHSNWMMVIFVKNAIYDEVETFLIEKNIQVRPLFYSISKHPYLSDIDFPDKDVGLNKDCGMMLPSYPELQREQQDYIVSSIREFLVLRKLI